MLRGCKERYRERDIETERKEKWINRIYINR